MLQRHPSYRSQRSLCVEALEDRMLLARTFGPPLPPSLALKGLVISDAIYGDTIQINQTTNHGVPTLTIQGSKATSTVPLSSVTSLIISAGSGSNTILLGNLKGFMLPGNIQIDAGSGANSVQLKDISAGQINFNGSHGTGTGTDTVNLTNVIASQVLITPGTGKLTVNQTNVTLGFDTIAAAGNHSDNTITITNSKFHPPPRLSAIGELSLALGNGNNSIAIDSIDVGPATISAGTGNNALAFSHSSMLQGDITLGRETIGAEGNNNVAMDTDTVFGQHLLLQTLNESGVTGFLNTSGASTPGVTARTDNVASTPDAAHRNQRHINQVTLGNIKFTTAFPALTPQLGIRMDDGDYYYDTQAGTATGGSTFVATGVSVPGIMEVNLGDHFQNVQLGNSGALVGGVPVATSAGQVVAGQLLVSAGNDLDTVTIAANVTGQLIPLIGLPTPFLVPANEFVQLGDNTINSVQGTLFGATANNQLPLPYVFMSGQVGTAAIDGNLTLTTGNNLSIPGLIGGANDAGSPLGWPVKQIETVIGHLIFLSGNLLDTFTTTAPAPVGAAMPFNLPSALPKLEVGQNSGVASPDNSDNGIALFLNPSIVSSDLRVFMGSGGFSHRESLVMTGVTVGNIYVQLASDGSENPNANPNFGVYIALDRVSVTDSIFGDFFDNSPPGLFLTDSGAGRDFVWLGVIPANNPGFGFGGGPGPVANDSLAVNGEILMTLSSGGDTLEAHNTTCYMGFIYAGSPNGNHYQDDGGNEGFQLFGFPP